MSSPLDQLGILLGRRGGFPGYPGARTPGWNPNAQPYPYPQVGTNPQPQAQPGQNPAQDPNAPKEDKPWYRSVYDGLVKNPMGQSFTLAMANALAQPLMPGQTETGKWVGALTQGYNSVAMLNQFRAAQEAAARAEGRDERKVRVQEQGADTERMSAENMGVHQTNQDATQHQQALETGRHNKATEASQAEDRKTRIDIADKEQKMAERKLEFELKKLNTETGLKERELGQKAGEAKDTAAYHSQMGRAALINAAANSLEAKTKAKLAASGQLTPALELRARQIATDEAQAMENAGLLGGDKETVKKNIEERFTNIIQRIGGGQQQQGGGQYQEGQTATGPGGQRIVYRGGQWVPLTGAK